MSPTTMRCGSSGELSLLSRRGATTSGGGKTKPDSWPEDGGAALRGEKRRSETEPTRVLEVDSTAETGVGKDIAATTGGDARAKAGAGRAPRRAGDWELEPELELCEDWRARGGGGGGGGKSDIKAGGGAREEGDSASFSGSIWGFTSTRCR